MNANDIAHLTPHQDVNDVLAVLTTGVSDALDDSLAGLYLTGSLTYGDFDPGSSDIDYLAVLRQPVCTGERDRLETLHAEIARRFPVWAERIEGSYVTRDMLAGVLTPLSPRPYVNGGAFWDPDPPYGNEWLINLYALRRCGIALVGPAREVMFPSVAIDDVRDASRRDLLEEWVPKLDEPSFFDSSHYQAYVALTLCRILHRANHDEVVSKRIASAWVKQRYPEPWIVELVERAERWQHGEELCLADQARDFIVFTNNELAPPDAV